MNPEVKQFLDAHPGYTTEGPDANGVTTYRSPSGDYINVRLDGGIAMRGFSPPSEGSVPAAPAATAAPAQAARGVGPTTKEALEARVGQTPGLVYQGQKLVSKTIKGIAGDQTVQVPVVTWINPTTGYTISAEVGEGGSTYTITADGVVESNIQSGSAAKTPEEIASTQATTANTQSTTAAKIAEEAEKDANAAKGRGRLTDAQWIAELARREAAAKAAGQQAEANRLAQERLNFDKEKEARPDIKVESIDLPNGLKGTRIIKTPKDGSPATIENRDENGKPLAAMPTPRSAEPPGAPTANLTLGQITQGLSDYSSWLNEQVRLWQTSGGKEGMSPDAATKAMETRRGLASSAISEQTGIANAQGEIRSQDITQRGQTLGETRSRRDTGREIYTNTLNQFVPQMKFLAPGQGAAFVGAMDEVNRNAIDYMRSVGGFRETPEVGTVGFLQDVRNMAGPGAAPGTAPHMFPYQATGGPAAPPAAMAPGMPDPGPMAAQQQAAAQAAAAAVPPTPPTPAAVNPVSTAPITPPVRPMPTPPPPMTPPARDDWRTDPGLTPLPPAPTPDQYQPAQPINMDPGQGPVGMRPTFLAPARFGVEYDPAQMAMQRIMSGANPDIVAEAFELQYGRPLQMAG